MGVTGLWNIISPVKEAIPLNQLSGQCLAVDLSTWICEDMSVKYNSSIALKLYIRNIFFRVVSLLKNDVLIVGVTDGEAPVIKAATMQKRTEARLQKEGIKMNLTKPTSTKRKRFSLISKQCTDLLSLLGVPSVDSPGEAESMCALLNSEKLVDACITNDGDAFLYGAQLVYKNFTMDNKDSHVLRYRTHRIESEVGLSRTSLVGLAVLLGCDYTEGVSGVGKERAFKVMQSFTFEASDNLVEFFSALKSAELKKTAANSDSIMTHLRCVRNRILPLDDFPSNEVIDEYLTVNTKWNIPQKKFIWKRPNINKVVMFCRNVLDWEEVYTLNKILPIAALWELRNPILVNEPTMKPIRIIRQKTVKFIPSFEVEWKRLDSDVWSDKENYIFSVSSAEFSPNHVTLVHNYQVDQNEAKLVKKNTAKELAKLRRKEKVSSLTQVKLAAQELDKMNSLTLKFKQTCLISQDNLPFSMSKSKHSTLSGSKHSTLSGSKHSTLSGSQHSTLSGSQHSTLSGSQPSALSGSQHSTLSGSQHSTLSGSQHSTLSGLQSSTLSGSQSSTLSGSQHSTLSGSQHSTLSGSQHSTLSGSQHSALTGSQYSTLSGSQPSTLLSSPPTSPTMCVSSAFSIPVGSEVKLSLQPIIIDSSFVSDLPTSPTTSIISTPVKLNHSSFDSFDTPLSLWDRLAQK